MTETFPKFSKRVVETFCKKHKNVISSSFIKILFEGSAKVFNHLVL